jgi:hypothetical protein
MIKTLISSKSPMRKEKRSHSNKMSSESFKRLLNIHLQEPSRDELSKHIEDRINMEVLLDQKLQEKIDYFISPYNNSIVIKPFVEYPPSPKDASEAALQDWKKISQFILLSKKQDFREALARLNQEFYGRLKKLAGKVLRKGLRRQRMA